MDEQLVQKLKSNFNDLSKGQKKVAKLLCDDPSIIAFSPAFEIGRMVNVSESTVIRLIQSLGYKGYTELQEIIRKSLPQGRVLTQNQKISTIQNGQSLIKDLMHEDINNIHMAMESISEEAIQEAASMIGHAEKIYVTGNLSTYGLAHFLSHWLNMLLGNAELIVPESPTYYTQVSRINQDSLVIPIIFPRYLNSTVQTTQTARQKGAKVLSITDSDLSPVTAYSDLIIKIAINSKMDIDSYAAPMSLIISLIRYVSIKEKDRIRKNIEKVEKVYKDYDIFYSN